MLKDWNILDETTNLSLEYIDNKYDEMGLNSKENENENEKDNGNDANQPIIQLQIKAMLNNEKSILPHNNNDGLSQKCNSKSNEDSFESMKMSINHKNESKNSCNLNSKRAIENSRNFVISDSETDIDVNDDNASIMKNKRYNENNINVQSKNIENKDDINDMNVNVNVNANKGINLAKPLISKRTGITLMHMLHALDLIQPFGLLSISI